MAEAAKTSKIEQFIVRFYKYSVFLIIVLLIASFISDVFKERYYIEEMEAPIFEEQLSITEMEIHRRLKDEMDVVYQIAHSLKGINPNVSTVSNPFSVDVGGISTNYFTLVDFVKFKFGIPYNCIAGTIYADGDKYCYRTRIGEYLVDDQTMTFDSTYDHIEIFNKVIRQQALGVVRHNDPYIAALYYYKSNQFETCIEIGKKSLENEPAARKFALGTIGNAYRELGQFEISEAYYLKSLEEFPTFYTNYWQYGRLQMVMKRYDEAEKNFLVTMKKDPVMQKAATRSLLELYCILDQKTKFAEMQNAYLVTGEMKDLQQDTMISKCLSF